jgi:hypothetical protein
MCGHFLSRFPMHFCSFMHKGSEKRVLKNGVLGLGLVRDLTHPPALKTSSLGRGRGRERYP